MSQDVDAGPSPQSAAEPGLAAWVTGMLTVLAGNADAEVPCGSCTACCTSHQFIHIEPDEAVALAAIPSAVLFPAPGRTGAGLLMGYDEQGRCPMFVDDQCSIYAARPRACRAYDCRIFTATGVAADPDKPRIALQVSRWELGSGRPEDVVARQAIDAARAHLVRTQDAIEPALRPVTAAQAAVVALLLSRAYLTEAPDGRLTLAPLDDAQAAAALRRILESAVSR